MRGLAIVLAAMLAVAGTTAQAAQAVKKDPSILDRLYENTGVYDKSAAGRTPGFVADPGWPAPLPHSWLLGQIGGLYVDKHDHIWVYQRPRTLTVDEAALETRGGRDGKNGLGQARPNGPIADCCNAAPSVLEFDVRGKLLRAWGGPADPGWMESHCKASDGCIWPNSEHGIYIDDKDNVWLAGNGTKPAGAGTPWTTNPGGGDGFVLKFDMDGNFKMRIGGTPTAPDSNDTHGGVNGTPLMYLPADMVVDPKTNRLYIADGYGDRRVLIIDADTGKYVGHFGAYGANPIDDAGAAAAGPWIPAAARGEKRPAFFRNPVHCVKIADDGKLYVCDRGNDRIQVFDGRSPDLGKPCANPAGVAGKCGYLTEQWISPKTETLPVEPGSSVSLNFSTDKAPSCLYIGDNSNMTIYVLNRANLQELGRLGRSGRSAGQFHWLHQVSLDSHGDIFTGEVDTGKRIQKFVRYGGLGCSGTGSTVVGGPLP